MVYTYGWRASYHTVIWGRKAPSDRWNRRGDEMTMSLLQRVPPAICCAKVSHAQLPDIPLRSDTQALRLTRVLLLSSGGESVLFVKKKVPSRRGFSASMHVVLKTRHANPNIHVRRH